MKKNSKIIVAIIALVVAIGIVAAVAMDGNKDSNTHQGMKMDDTKAVTTNMVSIKSYMFSPMDIKVKVGTTVTWTNQDPVNHTVTADTNTTDAPNSMDIAQGKSYSFTFKKAGTYTYHCFPHPYMHGKVEVTN